MNRRPGMNERQPCGTRAARITHLAHGEQCAVCGTDRLTLHLAEEGTDRAVA